MLVHLELHDLLLLLDGNGDDLVLEAARLDGSQGLLLGVVAELVQLLPGDAPDVADVLGGGAHVVVVISIPQAVLDHGVDDLGVAHASAPTVGGDGIGSAAHALSAAAHDEVSVAALDGAGALDDGLQTGAADHAHGVGGHLQGHAGLDHALTGHVLTLGSGQDVTEHDLIQPLALDVAALEGLGDDDGAQLSGRDIPQRAAEGADGGTAGADNIDISHCCCTSNRIYKVSITHTFTATLYLPPLEKSMVFLKFSGAFPQNFLFF